MHSGDSVTSRSGGGRADDDAGQLALVETRAGARRSARRQMSEASAIKDGISERRGRLQRQGGGAKLVWCLGARTLCHRAGQAWIGEGAYLDRPVAAHIGG
jgi:hypothetical protein